MNRIMLKSIGAVLAGFIFVGVTSTVTDKILEAAGVLPGGSLFVPVWLILIVLLYRAIYQVAGCYLVAKLAPHSPMKHALATGAIGLVLSGIAAIVTAPMHLGPLWYAWAIAVLSLPTAWLGGKLFLERQASRVTS